MVKYKRNIQKYNPLKLHPLNIDRQTFVRIPDKSRVLEIGCATGFIGKYLKDKKNCEVIGVEIGLDEAQEARKNLDQVILGDVESSKVLSQMKKNGTFDVVYASALIEHLRDPWAALIDWKKLLRKNGVLIITTSNIAHWSQRLHMLQGRFEYQSYGILDNTHLRFFTTQTFKKLVTDSGYQIKDFYIDPVGGGYPKISHLGSLFLPNLFTYQMGIVATS